MQLVANQYNLNGCIGSSPISSANKITTGAESMHLIPMVTEVQYNLVDDETDINSRKAVFRVRINGNIGWLDMLQGVDFFDYLTNNMSNFCSNLKKYGLDYIESNVSDEVLMLLKKVVGQQLIIIGLDKSMIHGLQMNHVRFSVL